MGMSLSHQLRLGLTMSEIFEIHDKSGKKDYLKRLKKRQNDRKHSDKRIKSGG